METTKGQVLEMKMEHWKQSMENLFGVLMGMSELTTRRLELVENDKEATFKLLEKKYE